MLVSMWTWAPWHLDAPKVKVTFGGGGQRSILCQAWICGASVSYGHISSNIFVAKVLSRSYLLTFQMWGHGVTSKLLCPPPWVVRGEFHLRGMGLHLTKGVFTDLASTLPPRTHFPALGKRVMTQGRICQLWAALVMHQCKIIDKVIPYPTSHITVNRFLMS